jgi:hypothetical protein
MYGYPEQFIPVPEQVGTALGGAPVSPAPVMRAPSPAPSET